MKNFVEFKFGGSIFMMLMGAFVLIGGGGVGVATSLAFAGLIDTNGERPEWWCALLFLGLPILIGNWLLLYRESTRILLGSRTVVKKRSFIWPIQEVTFSLDQFQRVVLHTFSGSTSASSYSVSLDGQIRLWISVYTTSFAKAQIAAEEAAELTGLPVVDD